MKNAAVKWLVITIAALSLSACERVSKKEDPLAGSIIDEAPDAVSQ
jgi:hypothetical protein